MNTPAHPVPTSVESREGYTIFVRFSDGKSGTVDLADWSNKEVFRRWEEREFFESVHINGRKAIAWGTDDDELDVCPDTIYLRLTGIAVEELFPEFSGLTYEVPLKFQKTIRRSDLHRLSENSLDPGSPGPRKRSPFPAPSPISDGALSKEPHTATLELS